MLVAQGKPQPINGKFSWWWSSSQNDTNGSLSWYRSLSYSHNEVLSNFTNHSLGKSARCVTNQLLVDIGLDYDGNGDGCVNGEDMLNILVEYGSCE